jgi:hypothetical protein
MMAMFWLVIAKGPLSFAQVITRTEDVPSRSLVLIESLRSLD